MMIETINILFVIRSERNVRTSSMQDGDIAGLLWTDAERRCELAGDRYINIFLSGVSEIPAYLVFFFMLQK